MLIDIASRFQFNLFKLAIDCIKVENPEEDFEMVPGIMPGIMDFEMERKNSRLNWDKCNNRTEIKYILHFPKEMSLKAKQGRTNLQTSVIRERNQVV